MARTSTSRRPISSAATRVRRSVEKARGLRAATPTYAPGRKVSVIVVVVGADDDLPSIGAFERPEVVKAHSVLAQDLSTIVADRLAHIERIADDKVMYRMRTAEVEAERVQGPKPLCRPHLCLLENVVSLDVAVVVHVRADEVQAEGPQCVRRE